MAELTDKQQKAAEIVAQQSVLVETYKASVGKKYRVIGDVSGSYQVIAGYNGVRQFADGNLYHTFSVHHFRPDNSSDAVNAPSCKLFLEQHELITQ